MGISLGLVGLGAFGSGFADLFYRHPLVSRVALCDREPERIRKFAERPDWTTKFHPRDAYDSLDAICRSDLDALVIMTQPWLHAPQAIQALRSGKHVYSAVPIISLPDSQEILDWCDQLVQTVRQTGQHYMLGETTFFRPEAMYCRRRAAAGDFGDFVYAEGEYCHDVDSPGCNLRQVRQHRLASKAGQEWLALEKAYHERGLFSGPMHYPTHSISGPFSVMKTHAERVACWGYKTRTGDPGFGHPHAFSNETALFYLSNGATMRICEYREIGGYDTETFRVFGSKGSFREGTWLQHGLRQPLTAAEMRDPLPPEVVKAWTNTRTDTVEYGGHGGSHAYLAHEFVDAIAHRRVPAINVWEAARYMAAGCQAHESARRDGEILRVPDWGDAPSA